MKREKFKTVAPNDFFLDVIGGSCLLRYFIVGLLIAKYFRQREKKKNVSLVSQHATNYLASCKKKIAVICDGIGCEGGPIDKRGKE